MINDWMEYHKKVPPRPIPRPLKSSNLKEAVGQWDADFVDVELEVLFDLLLCANFLGVTPLLELCCAKVSSMMLGKTPKQIRRTFNIREDFTPEEEAEVRKEFAEFL
jgi:S-phase kinase-associated protein 1